MSARRAEADRPRAPLARGIAQGARRARASARKRKEWPRMRLHGERDVLEHA